MFQLPRFDPCPFCENAAGRPFLSPLDGELVPCAVIEERSETLAFVNTRRPTGFADRPAPWVLVISKRHAPTLLDLSEAEAVAVMAHTHRIAKAVTAAFELDGLRLLQNNGIAGDQAVPHFHMHIIPCRIGSVRSERPSSERGPRVSFDERQRIAEQIRAHLDG